MNAERRNIIIIVSVISLSTETPVAVRDSAQGTDIVCASNRDRQIARHALMGLGLLDHVLDWEQRNQQHEIEYITTWVERRPT